MALSDIVSVSNMDGKEVTLLLGGVLFLFLWRFFTVTVSPEEPPLLKPKIPVIGHIIGMVTEGYTFYDRVFKSSGLPIATLPMLNGKMYLIRDPELIASMFKSRNLHFEPFLTGFIKQQTSITTKGLAIFSEEDFIKTWFKTIYTRTTGKHLQELRLKSLRVVARDLNRLLDGAENGQSKVEKSRYEWMQVILTRATMQAMYGDNDPFQSEEMINNYWSYHHQFPRLMVGLLPGLLAPEGHRGRRDITKAYEEYFAEQRHLDPSTSALIRDLFTLATEEGGITPVDQANLNMTVLHGALSNTVPMYAQFFDSVFSRPELVERLREEAMAGSVTRDGTTATLHIANLEAKCPLLSSCFAETLRLAARGSVNRLSQQDVRISDATTGRTYLLKANVAIQAVSGLSHRDQELWGADVMEFNPERSMRANQRREAEEDSAAQAKGGAANGSIPGEDNEGDEAQAYVSNYSHRGKFFPWGGGKHMCAGRNFASSEIYGMTIMLLLGFDVTAAADHDEEDGTEARPLKQPLYETPSVTMGIGAPVKGTDERVRFTRRRGWEGVQWAVDL